jgi:DNA-3-methyladenine glycosylase
LIRRGKEQLQPSLTAGPGAMSIALGILTWHTGMPLFGPELYIEDGRKISKKDIIAATRVGVAYAMDDALRPYRFYLKDNKYVSKGKGL